nr:MAG TPA: hypothetical protein [Bacteriophage sp.]
MVLWIPCKIYLLLLRGNSRYRSMIMIYLLI